MPKPNIVLITPHDSGRFFGFCGARGVATPQIDRLAADATHLTNFHAPGPVLAEPACRSHGPLKLIS